MATRRKSGPVKPPQRSQRGQSSGNGSDNNRREEIVTTAARIIAAKGFASTTVRDIGDECGILSGSLYYHFSSKEEILLEILEPTMDKLLAEYLAVQHSTADARTHWKKLFEVALNFVATETDAATILQNEFQRIKHLEPFTPLLNRYDEIRRTVWTSALKQGAKDGDIRADFDLDVAYRIIMGALMSSVYWLRSSGHYTVQELAEMYTVLLIDGLSKK